MAATKPQHILTQLLFRSGAQHLWSRRGPGKRHPLDLFEDRLSAYVINGDVYIFHLHANGGYDLYTQGKHTMDDIRQLLGEKVAATPAETSTPLTVEPM